LEAFELRGNGFGERLGEGGLAGAGIIFQEDVPAGGEGGEQMARGIGLAAHDFGNVAGDFLVGGAGGFEIGGRIGHGWFRK
jgi:hypothetical protein